MNNLEVFVRDRSESQMIDFYIKHTGAFVYNIQFNKVPSTNAGQTDMLMSKTEIQALINRLWNCGFRPVHYTDNVLDAVQRHLEDIRKLIFEDNY